MVLNPVKIGTVVYHALAVTVTACAGEWAAASAVGEIAWWSKLCYCSCCGLFLCFRDLKCKSLNLKILKVLCGENQF